MRKTGALKTCRKRKFLGEKIWRNTLALKSKMVQGIFGETFVLALLFSAVFCFTKLCLRFLLICFAQEIKGFYQSSLKNEVDFRGIMDVFPNKMAKNKNLKKLRHGLVNDRALITTTLISSCHWKTFVPFCLWKKRPENAFLILLANYHKIVKKNKLCHPKQHNNKLAI